MQRGNFGRHAWHSIWCLSGSVIIPLFWLAACQPATVPSERIVELTRSEIKAVQRNNGQNDKNSDQTKTTEENQRPVKLDQSRSIIVIDEPNETQNPDQDQPRSIIVIDEPNETQNPDQDQPLKDIDTVQQIDQKIVEPKTAAEIAAATAVMNSISWQFQAGEKETKILDPVIPSDQDMSLSEDALEMAFALLSNRATSGINEPVFEIPPKLDGVVRVGLLVPLSGKYAALGNEIRRSVEMALFTINNPKIELLFLDTKAGEDAGNAAMTGIKSGVDIFIGPLFTDAVIEARAVMDDVVNGKKSPPMLLLSNNVDMAATDYWLMGYLPEQQLDGLLGHAISKGKRKFAVIAQDTVFGQRLLAHANRRLIDFGLQPEALRVLSDEELADENKLKAVIRNFTRYVPPKEGELIGESPFDAVVFAGDPAFALRTAPVLAYYDVGPDRALYLGNALWNQTQLLIEPSLQGGLFARRPSNLDFRFDSSWDDIWPDPAGELARVGFDAMALVAALAKSEDKDWVKQLVSNNGFHGFSGAFRLLPNGGNIRSFELRQIENGDAKIIKFAPNKI
jgi:branched-chain amino acid transport system substrate-binding protein